MRFLSSALAALISTLSLTSAASLRIQIPPSTLLPNPNTLPANTHATLVSPTGVQLNAVLRTGNILEFPSISSIGSHLLNIYTRDYVFAPYRIDLGSENDGEVQITGAWEAYRGIQWSDHGVSLIPQSPTSPDPSTSTSHLTITAKILSRKSFYEDRPGFNALSLLKSPMVLMGLVGLVFAFGMPKMMENMDPDMRKEYEEMQKSGVASSMTKALQGAQGAASGGSSGGGGAGEGGFDLAGFLAGSQAKASAGGSGSGGIREKKR